MAKKVATRQASPYSIHPQGMKRTKGNTKNTKGKAVTKATRPAKGKAAKAAKKPASLKKGEALTRTKPTQTAKAPKTKGTNSLTSAAEMVGTGLGKLANQLDKSRQPEETPAPDMNTPMVGGVRQGHQEGPTLAPDEVKQTHAEWKARMKADRIAHKGIGKKSTHALRAVPRRLTFER